MPDAPPQVAADGSGSTPASPVQIEADGGAGSPSVPPVPAADGSGSTPASPVQIAADGSGSTPAAPVQVTANGSGSTPASPVQIAADGGGSTPAAPPAAAPYGPLAGNATVSGTLTDGTNPVVFPLLLKIPADIGATFNRYWTNTGIAYPDELGMFYHIGTVLVIGSGRRWSVNVANYTTNLISPASSASWRSDIYPADAMPDPWLATGWAPSGLATGTPVVASAQPAPPQVAANGTAATPAAPPAIV